MGKIYQRCFKIKNLLRGRAKARPALERIDMNAVGRCINSKDFDSFLEYLRLTVEEKNDIITTMNLFDQNSVNEAIKIQYTMRGILLVEDIVLALRAEFSSRQEVESIRETENE